MSEEFHVIETQEQLNDVIKDRLNRAAEKHQRELNELSAKYADYDDIKAKAEGYEKKISELDAELKNGAAKIADYEKAIKERDAKIAEQATEALKTGIAREFGLPDEIAARLSGISEEEIRKDAETLSTVFRTNTLKAPLFNRERENTGNAAYKTMLSDLFK